MDGCQTCMCGSTRVLAVVAMGLILGQTARAEDQPRGIVGRPDYASKSRRVAVFVHGCFWHGCPEHYREPKSNVRFWRAKAAANRKRDARAVRRLRRAGWRVIVMWEHEITGWRTGHDAA